MSITKIKIPKDTCNYMESLTYELNARKDLVSFMVSKGMMENENFKKYEKQYCEFFAEYELAKKQITETFVKPEHPNSKWNLDFSTGELVISEKE